MNRKVKIGISACVAGERVRFDKGHKKSYFCTEELTEFAELKPVCPEMAVGLPTPRPTIRQIQTKDGLRVSRPDGSGDVTEKLIMFGQTYSKRCSDLAGFIFCAKSPSCGMERVKVYHHHGKGAESNGTGLFAKQLMDSNPLLPVEENGRLNDPVIRENFITRVFTYQKWLDLQESGITRGKLIAFHSTHKYLVMSHNVESCRTLGRMLASPDIETEELAARYISALMEALSNHATRRSHTNTLQHLQGYLKKKISRDEKSELSREIEAFRKGVTPLLVPLTLIRHHLVNHPDEYLLSQTYLNPHPKELRLRYGY